MIRKDFGLEKLMIFLTGLRKYLCRECETSFRAPDRRRTPRGDPFEARGDGRRAAGKHGAA
jgi:hypothetical protein